ncbi:PIR protein [Plasmodium vivax]|uniref:VIR protein n=1 Tax=Plasmodium vivax TaxID=5855 RepID=A0A564ZNG6_PLAVI|nr:PIR protein [Plasmodium vivax]
METLDDAINKIPEIELYNNLSNVESDHYYVHNNLRECPQCKNTYPLNLFIGKITKNYNAYKEKLDDESNNNNYCRYFKYWLYKEKNLYNAMKGSLEMWNDCIPCLWDMLNKKRAVSGKKCEFENENVSFAIVQIIKIIDDMCAINTQTTLMNEIKYNREKCIEFNNKSKKYLVDILRLLSSIPNNISWIHKHFKIENSCSNRKITDLFAEINCLPEVKEKCSEPKECDTPAPETQKECTENSCSNLQELCKGVCQPTQCDCKDQVIKPDGQEPTPDILKQFCPNFCAANPQDALPAIKDQQGNPNKNPLLQVPVTVLSSVVGTIFFFLLLYKFTPFRTWFLNRIGSKKTLNHKMRQDMDREYLGVPFQPPYRDDQNSRPRVGYSQNKR